MEIKDQIFSIFNRTRWGAPIAILFITVGVVLLIGSLFLLIVSSLFVIDIADVHFVALIIELLPAVPFSMSWPNDLAINGIAAISIVTWVIGCDYTLLGLGIWKKHWMAKWVGIIILGIAISFDFVEFMFFGILGTPKAIFGLLVNSAIVYFFTKINFQKEIHH